MLPNSLVSSKLCSTWTRLTKPFWLSQFDPDASGADFLAASTRKAIEKAFYPERGYPTFKPGPARKVLREYLKVAPPKPSK